jgi:dTDP-6-deoxy-L-talose 4-dehydrogenase (NAD+)
MTTLALTGATGFVGRQILLRLLCAGHRVRIIARPDKIPADLRERNDVVIVETPDLFSEPAGRLSEFLAGVDTLIHAAWYVEPGKCLFSSLNVDCLAGTLRLAEMFTAVGGRRFVGIGTCFEYDTDVGILGVDAPLKPRTLYGACKAAAYCVLNQMLPANNVEFAWCRLFYLFGEGEDTRRLVPYVRSRLSAGEPANLSSGNQIRDYLDVQEAGHMITKIAVGAEQGAVNICSGVPVTIRQLAERIADEYGRRDLLRFGARPDNVVDPPLVVGVRRADLFAE